MKRFLSLLLCVMLCMTVFAGCGSTDSGAKHTDSSSNAVGSSNSGDVITIKLAHNFAASHPVSTTLESVAAELDEQSGGTIKLDIYGAGALGSNGEITQQMIAGEIDAVVNGACDNYAAYNPLLYVEDLPFLYPDVETAYKAYDGAYGEALAKIIDDIGCHTVAFWENGSRQMTNNVRPVTTPSDMAGLKMRSANATLFIKFFECLDCTVTMVDMSELFSALQQGMVDGQENPLNIILSSSYYEVQKYCTLTNHIYLSAPVVFNADVWNSYPAEVQDMLTKAFEKGTADQRAASQEMDSTARAKLEEHGMQVDDVTDHEEWVAALAPVWDFFKSEYGADGETLINLALQG